MKIACITTSRIPSNTANSIQVMKVCQALFHLGNDVRLWVPEFESTNWSELAEIYGLQDEFQITWLPFQRSFKQYDFCWKAVQAAKQWGTDVVYTWALQAAVFGLWKRNATVMEFHDYPMGKFGPHLFRIFMKLPGNRLILSTTRALVNGLEKRYQLSIPEQILQIAPNGSEVERYLNLPNPSQTRKLLAIDDRLTVVYSGHFYQGRGVELLLEIAQALPKIRFLWVGGRTEDVQPWKEKLQRLDIHNVVLTGFIPNSRLPLYQAAADILLMPYAKKISGSSGGDISEVINPMKMFDYLSAGRAIIASEIPVFREILNTNNAVFCEPENPAAWVSAIQKLAGDATLRKRLGKQAQLDAQRYSWKKRAENTLKKLHALMV